MSYTTNETKRRKFDRRLEQLKSKRQPWEAQWVELAEHNAPNRVRLIPGKGEGQKLRSKIIDSSGTFALRTLASGMHSGITSPARPWFKLATFDPELKEFAPVKEYLAAVETRLREVFQASNVYNAFHWGYGDLGLLGQSCGLLVEDAEKTVRMIQLLHGCSGWRAMTRALQRRFTVNSAGLLRRSFGVSAWIMFPSRSGIAGIAATMTSALRQ